MHEAIEPDPSSLPADAAPAPEPPEPPNPNLVDLLLRHPEVMLGRFDGPQGRGILAWLAAIALVSYAAYGLVVGSFAGGMQWWAAPLKLLLGISLCGLICFPSLYILVCLSGARARLPQVAGILLSLLALSGVFLAGFAPVAWIFSQSSNFVSFIAPVHFMVWFIAIFASTRMLRLGLRHWSARRTEWTGLWILVLVVTVLQMVTVLRPIVGSSTRLLEPERQFFLQHWSKTLEHDTRSQGE